MEDKQYLSAETYLGIIQELSNTISNLHIELALAKTQNKEILDYAQKVQNGIEQSTSPAEVVGVDSNE